MWTGYSKVKKMYKLEAFLTWLPLPLISYPEVSITNTSLPYGLFILPIALTLLPDL